MTRLDLSLILADACACDSRYDGCDHASPCGGPNDGTGRGPWCAECNSRRIAAISASLESLRARFVALREEQS